MEKHTVGRSPFDSSLAKRRRFVIRDAIGAILGQFRTMKAAQAAADKLDSAR